MCPACRASVPSASRASPPGLEPSGDLLDDLQRHAPPHRLRLLRDIHHATPAFADSLQQLVAPKRLAHGFVGCIGEIELDGGPGSFDLRGQQRFGLLMRGEQGFEARTQGGVAFAFAVEPRRAFRNGFAQRQLEQGFFAVRVHGCLLSVFSFVSAAAISSQDGARQM